jgi:predicted MPP superfamily phosphohydrolase
MPSNISNAQGDRNPIEGDLLDRTDRRKPFFRRVALVLVIAAAVLFADALFLEPYRIEVTHQEITGAVSQPLKIAHISDLHTHGVGPREREIFKILAEEQPDLIVVTGDTPGKVGGNYPECKEVYEQLHAPLGVWFVRGNWENDRLPHNERAYYRDAGIKLLVNSSEAVRPDVWMIGLDDPYSGTAKLDLAMQDVPNNVYTIALFHSPGYFDRIAGHVNLCLTGHTHGGQVRIPFVKPFWLPKGCGRYLEGWYNENGSQMYVSRGIGTSILPIRFLCRPELAFITIRPAA